MACTCIDPGLPTRVRQAPDVFVAKILSVKRSARVVVPNGEVVRVLVVESWKRSTRSDARHRHGKWRRGLRVRIRRPAISRRLLALDLRETRSEEEGDANHGYLQRIEAVEAGQRRPGFPESVEGTRTNSRLRLLCGRPHSVPKFMPRAPDAGRSCGAAKQQPGSYRRYEGLPIIARFESENV